MTRFTRHARLQMAARSISEAEVLEVLGRPETSYDSQGRSDRVVVLGRTGAGRRLKVVVTRAEPTVVVTAADRDQG